MIAIALALMISQPAVPQGPPAVPQGPPAVPMIPAQVDELPPIPAPETSSYDAAAIEARETGKPFIVYVNMPPRLVKGCVTTSVESINGSNRQRVLVTRDMKKFNDPPLPSTATATEVRVEAGLEDSRPASPFDRSNQRKSSAALDSRADASGRWHDDETQKRLFALWPKRIGRDGFVFYRQTGYSQYIAHNGSIGQDIINMMPLNQDQHFGNDSPARNPNSTIDDWVAPGGLHDVPRSKWQSYTAVKFPDDGMVESWQGDTPVSNAPRGALMKEQWNWPDGISFADMLVNAETGDVFELRMRTKEDGEWQSEVVYKDVDARPEGYVGARKKCNDCHERTAGETSQYFITLRRQDSVFSASPLVEGTTRLDKTWPIRRR
jgi:hypothetical protein